MRKIKQWSNVSQMEISNYQMFWKSHWSSDGPIVLISKMIVEEVFGWKKNKDFICFTNRKKISFIRRKIKFKILSNLAAFKFSLFLKHTAFYFQLLCFKKIVVKSYAYIAISLNLLQLYTKLYLNDEFCLFTISKEFV